MLTIAEQVATNLDSRTRDRHAEDEARYRRLIDQMARSESIDAESAAITIETLGHTSADVRIDVDRQIARIRLADVARTYGEALEQRLATDAACSLHLAESERILEERKNSDKMAVLLRDDAQLHCQKILATATKLGEDDTQQLRASAGRVLTEVDQIVRRVVAAKLILKLANESLVMAKRQGLKKAELSEFADSIDAAKKSLSEAEAALNDWSARWHTIQEERLTLPPADQQTQAPAAPTHPFAGLPGYKIASR